MELRERLERGYATLPPRLAPDALALLLAHDEEMSRNSTAAHLHVHAALPHGVFAHPAGDEAALAFPGLPLRRTSTSRA